MCFHITEDYIEKLRQVHASQQEIDTWVQWLGLVPDLDDAIANLEAAFAERKLGDGTGLLEADGLDEREGEDELRKLRAKDEQDDWRRIPLDRLAYCNAAPSFMNARGFAFHLPAFLIAQLNDQYPHDFIQRITRPDPFPEGWIEELSVAERQALAKLLEFVALHPGYLGEVTPWDHSEEVQAAVLRLNSYN